MTKPSRVLYENLDTSFVNLWALLRYLSRRAFIGRVHVELENYSADVFVNGSETPLVHEVDRSAGTDVVEEAALHRLVLRVRESSGSITVYEGAHESVPPSAETPQVAEAEAATPEQMRSSGERAQTAEAPAAAGGPSAPRPAASDEWSDTVRISGELIGAVDRAATALRADFGALFREARISLADDYAFLDPLAGQLNYRDSRLSIKGEARPEGFVTGVTEALFRVVAKLATGGKARRTRERIAIELAGVARKNSDSMVRSGFSEQLDRIAGTKVL